MTSSVVRYARIVGIMVGAIAALCQWSVLLERFSSAIWGWYKFWGYGGGGQITVAKSTQVFFYVLSGVLCFVSICLSRGNAGIAYEKPLSMVAKYSAIALGCGILFWTCVLLSPLAVWRE